MAVLKDCHQRLPEVLLKWWLSWKTVLKDCPKFCWSDGCLERLSSKTARSSAEVMAVLKDCAQRLPKVLLKWWLSWKTVLKDCPKFCWSDGCLERLSSKTARSSAEVMAVLKDCAQRLPKVLLKWWLSWKTVIKDCPKFCWSDGCLERLCSKTAQSSAEVMAVLKDCHQRLPEVLLKWWLSWKTVLKDCPKFCWSDGCLERLSSKTARSSAEVMAVLKDCAQRLPKVLLKWWLSWKTVIKDCPKFCWSDGCLERLSSKTARSSAEVMAVLKDCAQRLPKVLLKWWLSWKTVIKDCPKFCWSDGCLERLCSKTAQSSAEVMAVLKDCHQRLPEVLLKWWLSWKTVLKDCPKFCWSDGCLERLCSKTAQSSDLLGAYWKNDLYSIYLVLVGFIGIPVRGYTSRGSGVWKTQQLAASNLSAIAFCEDYCLPCRMVTRFGKGFSTITNICFFVCIPWKSKHHFVKVGLRINH